MRDLIFGVVNSEPIQSKRPLRVARCTRRLKRRDLVFVMKRQRDMVESFQKPLPAAIVDRKTSFEAARFRDFVKIPQLSTCCVVRY